MKAEMKLAELAILGVIIVAALLVIGLVWVLPAVGATQNNVISVYASGVSYALPMQSIAYLTINGTGNTTQLAAKNLSATLSALNSTMARYVNNNWTNVYTQSYSVYKVYNKSIYGASESISVTIPNISNSSAFLGSVSDIPNVYVSGIQPRLSDWQVTMLRSGAIQYAIANATAQARAVAGNGTMITMGNVSVGSAVVYPFSQGSVNAAVSTASSPAFYSGRGKVVESVTVQFKYG